MLDELLQRVANYLGPSSPSYTAQQQSLDGRKESVSSYIGLITGEMLPKRTHQHPAEYAFKLSLVGGHNLRGAAALVHSHDQGVKLGEAVSTQAIR